MSENPPANWYPDPEDPSQQRYWDGTAWTEHRAPAAGTQQPQPSQPSYQQPQYQQPQYQQPQYQQQGHQQQGYGQPGYQRTAAKTNGMAIASLVLAIVWLLGLGSLLGVILGIVAIRQINASNGTEGGKGMAIAGTIIGGLGIAATVLFFSLAVFVTSTTNELFDCVQREIETGEDLPNC